jgi:2-polyprenyl-3-methyl-5-hydroxy-6-metoxy-1,4-benzoquinol methylase
MAPPPAAANAAEQQQHEQQQQQPPPKAGPPQPQQQWQQIPYADPSYWEARYAREAAPFEWFLGYTALRRTLRAFLPKRKPVLQIGCGTSNVQEGMARAGWTVVNVSGLDGKGRERERGRCLWPF